MTEQANYIQYKFERASSMMRVHGILAVVFGSLGILGAILFSIITFFSALTDQTIMPEDAVLVASIAAAFIFVFILLPHVYLLISGMYLMKRPDPKTAKVLIIINLIVSALWNLVIFIFAIIDLTQINDYRAGYKESTPDRTAA